MTDYYIDILNELEQAVETELSKHSVIPQIELEQTQDSVS